MAIKVRHDGNAASGAAGSMSGGRAKRAMEAAAFAKPAQIQMTQGAHASAPGISMAHVTNAPNAPMASATMASAGSSGLSSARFAAPATSRPSTASAYPEDGGDMKVTGTNRFSRPDDDSVWNYDTHQWVRRWLPGEKKAEEAKRLADVQDQQWEFRFTQGQKLQQEQIRSDIADLEDRDDLTPEQKAIAREQLVGKLYGMKKLPHEIQREDAATQWQRQKEQQEIDIKKEANLNAKMASVFGSLSKPYVVKDTQMTDDGPMQMERTVVPDADETWQKVQGMFGANQAQGTSPVQVQNEQEKAQKFLAFFNQIKDGQGGAQTAVQAPVQQQPVVQQPVVQQPVVQQQPVQPVAQQPVQPTVQPKRTPYDSDPDFRKWYVENARPGTTQEEGYRQYLEMLNEQTKIMKDPRFRNDPVTSRFLGF